MPQTPKKIITAADAFYDLVKKTGEISFKDAAGKIGVPISAIEAWSTFLEEEGFIAIKYKLATPYATLPIAKKNENTSKGQRVALFDQFDRKESSENKELQPYLDTVTDLMDTVTQKKTAGELGGLDSSYSKLLAELKNIGNVATSKAGLNPQKKTDLLDQLDKLENHVNRASALIKDKKFDNATASFDHIDKNVIDFIEKATSDLDEEYESSNMDQTHLRRLFENIYDLLKDGKLEQAEQKYERIRNNISKYSHNFFSEKSVLDEQLVKLNRDLEIHANRIRADRMKRGIFEIRNLIKISEQEIGKKDLASASAHYREIQRMYHALPPGFVDIKKKLREDSIKLFEQLAKEREKALKSTFNDLTSEVNEKARSVEKLTKEGDLYAALRIFGELQSAYARLPSGFVKEKTRLQNNILTIQAVLSQKLETKSERELIDKNNKISNMLKSMKTDLERGRLNEANVKYSEVKQIYATLPKGFLESKTNLQTEIIDAYEALMRSKDRMKSSLFYSSMNVLNDLIKSAENRVKAGDIKSASLMYPRIKTAYKQMQPIDLKQRQEIRNRIIVVFRQIQMHNHKIRESMERQVSELKFKSEAEVKLPA